MSAMYTFPQTLMAHTLVIAVAFNKIYFSKFIFYVNQM